MNQNTQIALVTGAAHGIGLETCRQLAQQQITVILTARNRDKGLSAAKQLTDIGLDVHFKHLDVTDKDSVQRVAEEINTEFGHLDILINNAAGYANWEETASNADLEAAQSVLDTILFGSWRTVQTFLPLLRASPHGRIINVSSGAGSHGEPQFGLAAGSGSAPSYGIAKAALNALTVKLATELSNTNILVNAVDPGLTATYEGAEAMGARPIPDGAAGVVWAATLPAGGPTGGFFRDGQPLPW